MTTDAASKPQAEPIKDLIEQWAIVVTDSTMNEREQNINAKIRTVSDFFDQVHKEPHLVTSGDVIRWHQRLRDGGMSNGSVYVWVSRLSSFYAWRMRDPAFAEVCRVNPVVQGRPKAPVPYANAKPLNDDDLGKLIQVIHDRAETGDVLGHRDYALLLFYLLTGMSRADILRLRWGDVSFTDDSMIFTLRVHSGHKRTREITDPALREALLSYLTVSGRLDTLSDDEPIWIRHDPAAYAAETGQQSQAKPMSVQAVDKAMKRYAAQAGIKKFHLHRLRHSYARLIGEALHTVEDVRDALGHQTSRTTLQLLSQINIERDRISPHLARRLGLHDND